MLLPAARRCFRPEYGTRTMFQVLSQLHSSSVKSSTEELSTSKYKMFYKFPHMPLMRVICRLKLYQTAFTVSVTGLSITTSTESLYLTAAASFVALGMLGVMGEFCRRFVGAMYLDASTQDVKISHLTFFGNRRDLYTHVSDIVPLTDSRENVTDPYVRLNFYSNISKPLFLSVRHGHIVNRDAFQSVLGKL